MCVIAAPLKSAVCVAKIKSKSAIKILVPLISVILIMPVLLGIVV